MEKINAEVLVTKTFNVAQDWEVPIPGFFIIGSKDDTKKSFDEFTDEEVSEFALILKKVRSAMRTALGIDVVYVFQNEDTDHGFHVWMFPRYGWMEKFGKKIQSVRPIMEYSKESMMTEDVLVKVKEAAQRVKEVLA